MYGDFMTPFLKIVGYELETSEIRTRETGDFNQIIHVERARGFEECVDNGLYG
jgi:hypothetical protein